MNPIDFSARLKATFERNIATALRTLLQERHLYQSVEVPPTHTYNLRQLDGHFEPATDKRVAAAIDAPWSVEPAPKANWFAWCQLTAPDLKLFCATCGRMEAYNLALADEVFRRIKNTPDESKAGMQQAFVFAYNCQSCKGTPEVFVVRRRGLKLTNEGRSPIEHVAVPPFIPKPVRTFFSGAVVAHQSGQTLAGVFLLRTVLEQWARISTGTTKEQADQVMEEYMATLPDDFKGRFPSMRALYGELSVDIHAAHGSPNLFGKARDQVVEHFDACRIYRLPTAGAAAQADPAPSADQAGP